MPKPEKVGVFVRYQIIGSSTQLGNGNAKSKIVIITADEFVTIKLIDLERLNQEEYAQRAYVARTTAQAIYNSTRMKLAKSLVNGIKLSIQAVIIYLARENTPTVDTATTIKKCHLKDTAMCVKNAHMNTPLTGAVLQRELKNRQF